MGIHVCRHLRFIAGRMCVGIRKQSVAGYVLVVSGLASLKSTPFQNDSINLHSSLSALYPFNTICLICDRDVRKHAVLTTIKAAQWAPLGSHIR